MSTNQQLRQLTGAIVSVRNVARAEGSTSVQVQTHGMLRSEQQGDVEMFTVRKGTTLFGEAIVRFPDSAIVDIHQPEDGNPEILIK